MEAKLEKARTEARREKVLRAINKGKFLDKLKQENAETASKVSVRPVVLASLALYCRYTSFFNVCVTCNLHHH